jgi:pimeloyl-ACP methyl ester carboxylesterase
MDTFGQTYIPTVHIIGRKDLWGAQSLEVVKSCIKNTAHVLLLKDGGHDILRDAVNIKGIGTPIGNALRLAFAR